MSIKQFFQKHEGRDEQRGDKDEGRLEGGLFVAVLIRRDALCLSNLINNSARDKGGSKPEEESSPRRNHLV